MASDREALTTYTPMLWATLSEDERYEEYVRVRQALAALAHNVTCEHGVAMDIHCCGCHSGFLFDVTTCKCLAALAAPPSAQDGWQPIETAPKDGREVLLRVKLRAGIPGRQLVGHYMPGGHSIQDHPPIDGGWYFWNGCMFDRAAEPIEWMPLPTSPAGAP